MSLFCTPCSSNGWPCWWWLHDWLRTETYFLYFYSLKVQVHDRKDTASDSQQYVILSQKVEEKENKPWRGRGSWKEGGREHDERRGKDKEESSDKEKQNLSFIEKHTHRKVNPLLWHSINLFTTEKFSMPHLPIIPTDRGFSKGHMPITAVCLFWSIQSQLLSVYLDKHPGESTTSSPISPWSCLRYNTNELPFSLWP